MCTGYSVGKDCGHRLRGRNQVGSCTGKTVICQLLPFHPNLKYWRHCGIMPKPDCCCVICTTAVLYARLLLCYMHDCCCVIITTAVLYARLLLCYMHNCCVICTTAAVLYARLLCVTCTTRVSTVVQLGLCPQKRKEKKRLRQFSVFCCCWAM